MTGQNIVWLLNGASAWTSQRSCRRSPTRTGPWSRLGDVSADSKADVIWRNRVTGQNIAWLMDGTAVSISAFLPTIADTNWEIKTIGDMNVDFMADVVWRNKQTGQNIQWLMSGLTVSSATFLPTIADINWEIVGR